MTAQFSPMRLTTLFICFFLFAARAKAQDFTCPVNQCTYNQSSGSTTSMSASTVSSLNISASSKSSTSGYQPSASSNLSLESGGASSYVEQSVGYEPRFDADASVQYMSTIPVTLEFETGTTAEESSIASDGQALDLGSTSDTDATSTDGQINQSIQSSSSESSNAANASFAAEGLGATQNLKYSGSSNFSADISPVAEVKNVNGGSGDAFAGVSASTNFNASVNSSSYVNAFISSF